MSKYFLPIFLLVITTSLMFSQTVVLPDNWLFRTGDDLSYKGISIDETGWVNINVPGNWEDQGFPEYDGYAWYRLHFTIDEDFGNQPLYLFLGKIDDADETYLNGVKIGSSGKLPMTFPMRWEDCSAFNTYKKEDSTTRYEEGIYVGYRHFEKNNIKPLFPFGFGLSYTTFKYNDLKLSSKEITKNNKLTVTLKVENTGNVKGSEVLQLYVRDVQSTVDRPVKELKSFKKVSLNPGEEKTVEMIIDKSALSFFDSKTKEWTAENGEFEILIGSSSQDIKLREKFSLK
ncbi:MAG: fibronectin type III-like domain-contianing protein [Ignavibacteriales bacterium]|nr:fibronectin type III-like domain-contianing protein [Ignavibacteriales bacterium]